MLVVEISLRRRQSSSYELPIPVSGYSSVHEAEPGSVRARDARRGNASLVAENESDFCALREAGFEEWDVQREGETK